MINQFVICYILLVQSEHNPKGKNNTLRFYGEVLDNSTDYLPETNGSTWESTLMCEHEAKEQQTTVLAWFLIEKPLFRVTMTDEAVNMGRLSGLDQGNWQPGILCTLCGCQAVSRDCYTNWSYVYIYIYIYTYHMNSQKESEKIICRKARLRL